MLDLSQETPHLMALLKVDQDALFRYVFPDLPAPKPFSGGIVQRMHYMGKYLLKVPEVLLDLQAVDTDVPRVPDIVRGWMCFAIGFQELPFEMRLAQMLPFAKDVHFGVREWAWMALRGDVVTDFLTHRQTLEPLCLHPSPYIRRFVSELTRPRGVWCAHSALLKDTPWAGYGLIHPLRSDPHRYVQLSVGNWLNDAAKTHPDWVRDICAQWRQQGHSDTEFICKRALRRLEK